MRTVHKYKIEIAGGTQCLNVPRGARILKFGEQDGELFSWIEVNTENDILPIEVEVYGTGHTIGYMAASWLGTVQMSNGLAWHIYQKH